MMKGKQRLIVATLAVVLVWMFSVYAVRGLWEVLGVSNLADLATILFGAASIALFIFSLLIALSAVIGWKAFQEIIIKEVATATEEKVNARVESFRSNFEATNKNMRDLKLEMQGRALATRGYILGQLSIPAGRLFPKPEDKGRLLDAVSLSRQAFEILENVSEPAAYLALNNSVIFSCALSLEEGEVIVGNARKLLEMANRKNSTDLKLTGCRALLQYGRGAEERSRARNMLRDLVENPNTTQGQVAEANLYLKEFPGEES